MCIRLQLKPPKKSFIYFQNILCKSSLTSSLNVLFLVVTFAYAINLLMGDEIANEVNVNPIRSLFS